MKEDLFVYVCNNEHINYAKEAPMICKECGSPRLTKIHGVMVNKEMDNGISRESEHHSS